jgi:5-methylcytosine-specific restriction endonuclease McrA
MSGPNYRKKPVSPLKKQLLAHVAYLELDCCYCGKQYGSKSRRTIDHIVPKVKEGTIASNNILICCEKCNVSKGSQSLKEYIKNSKKIRRNLFTHIENFKNTCCLLNNRDYYEELKWVRDLLERLDKENG